MKSRLKEMERNDVINGIEHCLMDPRSDECQQQCEGCPYDEDGDCVNTLRENTLNLLTGSKVNDPKNKTDVISHLQIMHTWATFALEQDMNFFNETHMQNIAKWTNEAISVIKEQIDEECNEI